MKFRFNVQILIIVVFLINCSNHSSNNTKIPNVNLTNDIKSQIDTFDNLCYRLVEGMYGYDSFLYRHIHHDIWTALALRYDDLYEVKASHLNQDTDIDFVFTYSGSRFGFQDLLCWDSKQEKYVFIETSTKYTKGLIDTFAVNSEKYYFNGRSASADDDYLFLFTIEDLSINEIECLKLQNMEYMENDQEVGMFLTKPVLLNRMRDLNILHFNESDSFKRFWKEYLGLRH